MGDAMIAGVSGTVAPPGVGRIVRFVMPNGDVRPAVVLKARYGDAKLQAPDWQPEILCSLSVLTAGVCDVVPPFVNPKEVSATGFVAHLVAFAPPGHGPCTWHLEA